ncbi:MAG: hypothetical protein ACRDVG_15750 [Jatrophihabitantaceae bacterium]
MRESDDVGGEDLTQVSRRALRLHAQGLLDSVEKGRAGFVSDDFLASLGGDAAAAVVELCVLGIWARRCDGYRVMSSEASRMADEVFREVGRLR